MDVKKTWHRFLGRPTFDKIFYVPFWDCPYMCDFCCVDSLPGKPPLVPNDGEELLFQLVDLLHQKQGNHIELHLYGGEPMLRKPYAEQLAKRIKKTPNISKLFLYTTLLSNSPQGIYDILGDERLSIIVNPSTVNEKVKKRMEAFEKVAILYQNQVFFPTGRGAVGMEGNQANIWQRILPIGLPGRSCFAASSGMLVNGQQHSVHLCCLPQSPIIGTFSDSPQQILSNYETALKTIPQQINREARQKKCVHPCQICNDKTGYQSTAGSGCNSYTIAALKEWEKL